MTSQAPGKVQPTGSAHYDPELPKDESDPSLGEARDPLTAPPAAELAGVAGDATTPVVSHTRPVAVRNPRARAGAAASRSKRRRGTLRGGATHNGGAAAEQHQCCCLGVSSTGSLSTRDETHDSQRNSECGCGEHVSEMRAPAHSFSSDFKTCAWISR